MLDFAEQETEKELEGAKKELKGSEKELKNDWKGNRRKIEVLSKMAEIPTITQTTLAELFGLTRKQIQKVIKELQEEGKLTREGSKRNGKWIVKKEDST